MKLKSVNFNTTATFRCEVSADEPDFQTVHRRANMTVIRKCLPPVSWAICTFYDYSLFLASFPIHVVQLEYPPQKLSCTRALRESWRIMSWDGCFIVVIVTGTRVHSHKTKVENSHSKLLRNKVKCKSGSIVCRFFTFLDHVVLAVGIGCYTARSPVLPMFTNGTHFQRNLMSPIHFYKQKFPGTAHSSPDFGIDTS